MWVGPDPDGAFMTQSRAVVAQAASDGAALGPTVSGDFTADFFTFDTPERSGFSPPDHRYFRWQLPLTAEEIIGLLGTLSWVIVMDDADRSELFATARRLLRDFLGVEGEVTVDVDFVCQVYASRVASAAP